MCLSDCTIGSGAAGSIILFVFSIKYLKIKYCAAVGKSGISQYLWIDRILLLILYWIK